MLSQRLHMLEENSVTRTQAAPGLMKPGFAGQASTRGPALQKPSAPSTGPTKPGAAGTAPARRAFGEITNAAPAPLGAAPGGKRSLAAPLKPQQAQQDALVKPQARVKAAAPRAAPAPLEFSSDDFSTVEFVHGTDLMPPGGAPFNTGLGLDDFLAPAALTDGLAAPAPLSFDLCAPHTSLATLEADCAAAIGEFDLADLDF